MALVRQVLVALVAVALVVEIRVQQGQMASVVEKSVSIMGLSL